MAYTLQPWQVFLTALAGWINRHQQAAIDFLREENRVLLEQLGNRRIRLTDDQRRRLAVAGKAVGRKALLDLAGIVTPDTILAWHRKLVAAKWDQRSRRGPGRPGVMKEIEKLTVRFARENPRWGYRRIEGALANLGHQVARTTVANILKRNGIDPAPERGCWTSWRTFLGAHWSTIAAIDFTTVEVWGRPGLVAMYVLFVIELRGRRVHFARMTLGPDDAWIRQVGRNLTDAVDGFLINKRFCLMDRDAKFTTAFRCLLREAGIESVRLPPRSPNLNAWIERFMHSIKSECLDRMIFLGEDSLRRAVREYVTHFDGERNHQGLDNALVAPLPSPTLAFGRVRCSERLGGMPLRSSRSGIASLPHASVSSLAANRGAPERGSSVVCVFGPYGGVASLPPPSASPSAAKRGAPTAMHPCALRSQHTRVGLVMGPISATPWAIASDPRTVES